MSHQPLSDAPPPKPPVGQRHNLIYTACLIALAVLCGMGIVSMTFMSLSPNLPPQSQRTFQIIACIYGVLVAAMVVTLILRGLGRT